VGSDFWPEAIREVKDKAREFLMLAEAYWGYEWSLLEQGFDYVYCKPLYDRLLQGDLRAVNAGLRDNVHDQHRLVRFIEKHDERRAPEVFGPKPAEAAATVVLTLPGLRLVHEGQMEGCRQKLPVQLGRRPLEPLEPRVQRFYSRLLSALSAPVFHDGRWRPLHLRASPTGGDSDCSCGGMSWSSGDEKRLIVANLTDSPAHCMLPIELPGLDGHFWVLEDLLGEARYLRDGSALQRRGLNLDIPPYGCYLFRFRTADLRYRPLRSQKGAIYDLAWSPDGREMASGGVEKLVWVENVAEGTARRLEGHQDAVSSLAWAPDGRMLASGSYDRSVRLWNPENGTSRATLEGHHNRVLSVAWSPDGRTIASGSIDRLVHLWDVESGQLRLTLGGHIDSVNSVAWPADGRILASGMGDGTIGIWDADSGKPIRVLHGHSQRVLRISFSSDSHILASKSADGTI